MFQSRAPLYMEIAKEIRKRITEGIYAPGQQLPSEPELAAQFGVSRGTLREALSVLEKEGAIRRKHGIGSFVEAHYNKVVAGIEKLDPLIDTIRRSGYEAKDQVLSIKETKIDAKAAEALEVEAGSVGYVIESIRLADQEPVIYCFDILPQWLIPDPNLLEQRYRIDSLSSFLKETCHVTPFQFISTVSAVLPFPKTMRVLGIDKKTPLILIEGTLYDEKGKPLNYGKQLFRSNKYQFHLVRK
ncbi:MAG: GntR family transcriptional regulator [Clostridia bacterium]|nr:GntR family transcriptional regulator [Clostridia bacterium]